MASNPFRPQSKAGASARHVPGVSLPRPVGRRPPGSFPRRPLPRVIPISPKRFPPVRTEPLFPGRLPRGFKPPFGKRLPFGLPPGPTAGMFDRLLKNPLTWDAAAMMMAMLIGPKTYRYPAGWIKCWDLGGPKQAFSGPTTAFAGTCDGSAGDQGLGGQVPAGVDGSSVPSVIAWPFEVAFWRGPLTSGGTRMTYTEKWRRPAGAPAQTFPYVPTPLPNEWPLQPPAWWWPWTDPLAPEGPPIAPPVKPNPNPHPKPADTPARDPDPDNDPKNNPHTRVRVRPRTKPSDIPSIDINPEPDGRVNPKPDVHHRKPPDEPKEREKKKRMDAWTSARWLRYLKKAGDSFTEMDDLVTAIYKGLPWQYRRWKGSDGVWRDRDITTDTRLERLYSQLGELNITDAIQNVVKNEFSDRAYGKLGNVLKRRARALGDKGLWASSGGFQRGNSLTRDQWDVLYDQLKKDAAKDAKVYQYTTRVWNERLGRWEEVVHNRPVMMIPWYKQVSKYPLQYYDAHGRYHVRRRYYYAPTATPNDI